MATSEVEIEPKHTVLLVDDDSTNLAVFGQFLMARYSVLVAKSGVRALEIAQSDPKPDLILLDIMMPGMDGYQVIGQLKANPETREIPVIFVTALSSDADETRGMELGAVDYIYKPCNLAILSARVRAQLELKQARDLLRNQNAQLEAELERRLRENQAIQLELLQAENLAAIGRLAAYVAHEINNPLGFIYSNFNTLQGYNQELFSLLARVETLLGQSSPDPEQLEQLRKLIKQQDLDFLRSDIAELLAESRDGLVRVRNIVQKLNTFGESGVKDWSLSDVNECLDATLGLFAGNKNMKCDIRKQYGDLPVISCIPTRLNQAFLSLLSNAAHAVDNKGTIFVRTGCDGEQVWVEIADDGCGIAPEHIPHLFEPFFTTRPLGEGMGLGLTSTAAIVRTHHGRIEVSSMPGHGAAFKIWLPIQQTS